MRFRLNVSRYQMNQAVRHLSPIRSHTRKLLTFDVREIEIEMPGDERKYCRKF